MQKHIRSRVLAVGRPLRVELQLDGEWLEAERQHKVAPAYLPGLANLSLTDVPVPDLPNDNADLTPIQPRKYPLDLYRRALGQAARKKSSGAVKVSFVP